MTERDPIDLIKDQLNRVDQMAGLDAEHKDFIHWHQETKLILEKIFGQRSIRYQNFLALRFREMSVKGFESAEIDKINSARYKKDLENVKNILHSAIKELTLDRTLFKKIQTTPKMVEVAITGEYYLSSGIEDPNLIQAVQNAYEGSGLTPLMGHEVSNRKESLQQRIDQIRRSKFGIYDITNLKIETFLEIGVALGLGKGVIITYRKGSLLPEMLRPFDPIDYQTLSELTEKLKNYLHRSF